MNPTAPGPVLLGAKEMHVPLKEIASYIRSATTEELLDRVTVYRDGMEPAALDLMEGELDRRGVTRTDIADYDEKQQAIAIRRADGTVRRCEKCDRPAIHQHRGWHKIYGLVPIFRRAFYLCEDHQPHRSGPNPNTGSGS